MDRTLAFVTDTRKQLLGFIVQVAGRARWADRLGEWRSKAKLDATCWKTINDHLNRFQTRIDSGEQPLYEIVRLPKAAQKIRTPPRAAAINETLRNYSPCSLTARDSELNAEGAWLDKGIKRDQKRS